MIGINDGYEPESEYCINKEEQPTNFPLTILKTKSDGRAQILWPHARLQVNRISEPPY